VPANMESSRYWSCGDSRVITCTKDGGTGVGSVVTGVGVGNGVGLGVGEAGGVGRGVGLWPVGQPGPRLKAVWQMVPALVIRKAAINTLRRRISRYDILFSFDSLRELPGRLIRALSFDRK
jgi:hypothetical protein